MTPTIRSLAAAVGVLATMALPLSTNAMSVNDGQHYRMQTVLANRFWAGEYDGTLDLTVYPSGIIQGLYRPLDGAPRTVTGGLDGKKIWLDIGFSGRLHLTGTFDDGALQTVAAIPGPDTVTFDSISTKRTGR